MKHSDRQKRSGRRRRKRKSLKSKKHYNWCISHPILFSNKTSCRKQAGRLENSLAVQWLRLGAFTAKGPGLKSGGGTKILKVAWPKIEIIFKKKKRNSPGSSAVKALPFNTRDVGSIPAWGGQGVGSVLRSHTPCSQKNQNMKQNYIVTHSIKTCKMVHIRKIY